jgi:hypothetical protein
MRSFLYFCLLHLCLLYPYSPYLFSLSKAGLLIGDDFAADDKRVGQPARETERFQESLSSHRSL